MATRRALSSFLDTYLKHYLTQQNAAYQSDLVGDRQREAAGLQRSNQLQDAALRDPTGRIAAQTGQFGLRPDPDTLLSAIRAQIANASTVGAIPTTEGIRGQSRTALATAGYDPSGAMESPGGLQLPMQRQSVPTADPTQLPSARVAPVERPEIAALIAEREAQRGAITNANTYEDDRKIAVAGGEVYDRARMTNQAANDFLPDTETRARTSAAGALGDVLTARRATDPMDILKASQIAQNAAALEFSPARVAQRLDYERQVALVRADATESAGYRKMINDSTNQIIALQPDLQRMADLSVIVNTSGSRQVRAPLEGYLQTDKNATELDGLADSVAMRVANTLGGNVGAQSLNDKQAALVRLPTSADSAETAQRKIAQFNVWLHGGLKALEAAPPGVPPADRIDMARRALGLSPVDRTTLQPGSAPLSPPDPQAEINAIRQFFTPRP